MHDRGPWERWQVDALITMRKEGRPSDAIARAIGRSIRAILTKARDMNLPPSAYKSVPPHRLPKDHRSHQASPAPRAGKTTLPPLKSLSDMGTT